MHLVAKFTLWLFVDRVKSAGATAQRQPGRPRKRKSHDNEKQMFPRGSRSYFVFVWKLQEMISECWLIVENAN